MRIAWVFVIAVGCGKSKPAAPPSTSPLDTAYGATVATPGPLFEGLVVGGPEDESAKQLETRWDVEVKKTHHNVRVTFVDGTIASLGINTKGDGATARCDKLRGALDRAWAKPIEIDTTVVWFAPDRKHRTTMSRQTDWCSLTFERYTPVAEMFPASLFALVGQPKSAVEAAYKTGRMQDDSWDWSTTAGLGPAGGGMNGIAFSIDDGKTTGLVADGFVGAPVVAELRAHLDTLFGPSTEIAGIIGLGYRWPTGAVLTYQRDLYKLAIGGHPPPAKPGRWSKPDRAWIYRYEDGDEIVYGDDASCRLDDKCESGSDCQPAIKDVACPPLPPDAEPAH